MEKHILIGYLRLDWSEKPIKSIRGEKLKSSTGMHPNSFGCGPVPRSLVSQKVKILPVLFTRVSAEADSGRVSHVSANLKSLRRSLAWSESEPEVGYAGDDPPATWGSSMPL
jgi:hypothetical protein